MAYYYLTPSDHDDLAEQGSEELPEGCDHVRPVTASEVVINSDAYRNVEWLATTLGYAFEIECEVRKPGEYDVAITDRAFIPALLLMAEEDGIDPLSVALGLILGASRDYAECTELAIRAAFIDPKTEVFIHGERPGGMSHYESAQTQFEGERCFACEGEGVIYDEWDDFCTCAVCGGEGGYTWRDRRR